MIHNYKIKIKLTFCCLFFITFTQLKAQNYVTIPDTNFVKYLVASFGSCMSGNQLDTSCADIKTITFVNLSYKSISDLTGIQYFTGLKNLYCGNNLLKTLPPLANMKLELLNCNSNLLVALPPLPKTLCSLECNYNKLTFIPTLNSCTIGLMCSNNQITSLPEIPAGMQMLLVNDNKITCLPPLPDGTMYMFNVANNPFTCVSNYISLMDSTFRALHPICKENDNINNPYKCYTPKGIRGFVFKDNDNDCKKTSGDWMSKNVGLKLHDSTGQVVAKAYSRADGFYEFYTFKGKYKVEVDTAGMPFQITCPYPGIDSSVTVSSWIENVDFSVSCNPGFDLGIQSIYTQGLVFPGQQHTLNVMAGKIDNWYNLNCVYNSGGQVKFTVSGPVTYIGPAPGALTPVVSGNTYTYNISNLSTIKNATDFALLLKTNTTAQATDRVYVTAEITPVSGDVDIFNNSGHFAYNVFNSHDPNMKEVDPVDVLPGYKDWFTYTIHFQNTGNAPAINILLADTLDKNLDLETFQVLNYSHFNQTTIKGNTLEFKFPDIQLADSSSDEKGSKGFIQYRIKPKANLVAGTMVKNTAFIYFDYNAAVVTNTTINHFTTTVSVNENKENKDILIYPNPSKGSFYIELGDKMLLNSLNVEIYNILGKLVWSGKPSSKTILVDLNYLPDGIYVAKIQTAEKVLNQRLIKE